MSKFQLDVEGFWTMQENTSITACNTLVSLSKGCLFMHCTCHFPNAKIILLNILYSSHLYMESSGWRRCCFDVRVDHVIRLQAFIAYESIPEGWFDIPAFAGYCMLPNMAKYGQMSPICLWRRRNWSLWHLNIWKKNVKEVLEIKKREVKTDSSEGRSFSRLLVAQVGQSVRGNWKKKIEKEEERKTRGRQKKEKERKDEELQ